MEWKLKMQSTNNPQLSSRDILTRPAPKKPARRLFLIVVGFPPLFIIAGVISLLLINENWLVKELTEKAAEHLGADLEIGSIEVDVLRGKAELRDIKFERLCPTSAIRGNVARADLNLDVSKLIFRRFEFERLLLESPDFSYEKLGPTTNPDKQAPSKPGSIPYFRFGQLIVHDGAMTYKSRMDTPEPFEMDVTSLDYLSNGVSIHWLFGEFGLLHGAYLEADIKMGPRDSAPPAHIRKLGTSPKEKFSIKGVDLAYLDRILDRTDAIDISDGDLTVRYFVQPNRIRYEVTLKDFALFENYGSSNSTKLLIPASRIVDFADSRSGDLKFEFALDKHSLNFSASADLEDAVRLWFDAFWREFAKQAIAQGVTAEPVESIGKSTKEILREAKEMFSGSSPSPAI